MTSSIDRQRIEDAIVKVYNIILSTKNISARYIAILAIASLWIDAYDFSAFSYGIASFKATFPWISPWLLGLVATSINIGALFGTVFGGWLTDRLGRRAMFTLNMILFTVVAIAAGFAPDPYTVLVLRTLLGFALGADVATGFAYVFEYMEKTQRLWWSYLWNLQWYTMLIVVSYAIVYPFYITVHTLQNPLLWRIIFWIGGVLAGIILAFRSRIPESIMWLAYQGRLATVRQLLKKIYNIDLPPDIPI